MSAALFDLALRVAARDHGGPVPRLLHNPAPARDVKVAVAARRTGPVVHVQAVGPDGRTESGSGAQGLAAIARAAGCAGGDLDTGATALVDTTATLRALAGLAPPTRTRRGAPASTWRRDRRWPDGGWSGPRIPARQPSPTCWPRPGNASSSASPLVPITRMPGGKRYPFRPCWAGCTSGTEPSPAGRCCRGWTRSARTTTGYLRASRTRSTISARGTGPSRCTSRRRDWQPAAMPPTSTTRRCWPTRYGGHVPCTPDSSATARPSSVRARKATG